MKKQRQDNAYLPTKTTLVIRILVGVYLLYTSYSLKGALAAHAGGELCFFLFFTAAFALAGAALIFFPARALVRGNYAGAAPDQDSGR